MWGALHSFLSNVRGRWRGGKPVARAEGAQITLVALVAGDQDRKLLSEIADRSRWSVHFADTCEEAWTELNRLKAPVILCDRDLPDAEWREVVQRMASSAHRACAILVSRVVDDYLWNEVIGKGGYDVLAKPLRADELIRSVKLAWSFWNSSAKMPPLRNYG